MSDMSDMSVSNSFNSGQSDSFTSAYARGTTANADFETILTGYGRQEACIQRRSTQISYDSFGVQHRIWPKSVLYACAVNFAGPSC